MILKFYICLYTSVYIHVECSIYIHVECSMWNEVWAKDIYMVFTQTLLLKSIEHCIIFFEDVTGNVTLNVKLQCGIHERS